MKVQAITGNLGKTAQNVWASVKDAGANAKTVLGGQEKYVSQRLESNADNIFKSVKSDKQFEKMFAKVEKKAIQDFGLAKKQLLKNAGVAAAVVAGVALLGIGISKLVKSNKAKKEAKANALDANA